MTKQELIQALEETPMAGETPVLLKLGERVVSLEVVRGVLLNLAGVDDKVPAIWLSTE